MLFLKVCFMFYKNILMSVSQFWFNFNCAFSGQKVSISSLLLCNMWRSNSTLTYRIPVLHGRSDPAIQSGVHLHPNLDIRVLRHGHISGNCLHAPGDILLRHLQRLLQGTLCLPTFPPLSSNGLPLADLHLLDMDSWSSV